MISIFYLIWTLLSGKQALIAKNKRKIMFVRKLLLQFWGYGHAVFRKTSANYLILRRSKNDFEILSYSDAIVRKAGICREK